MMEKLKLCPFCGNEPTIRIFKGKDGWRDGYAVICRYDEGGCGAESGLYHYESEAIEAWNRRAEPQWIPCSERLPEKTQLCLVTEKTVVGLEICTRCFNKRNDGGFWSGWGHTDVIAWMPLPEPHKERREE